MNDTNTQPSSAPAAGSAMDCALRYRITLENIRHLSGVARDLENRLGIANTKHLDRMDGTPYEEWECKSCGHRWLSTAKIPCSLCHPKAFEAMRSLEMLPNTQASDGRKEDR